MSNKRIHLIANPKSGNGLGATLPELAKQICDEYDAKLIVHSSSVQESFDEVVSKAVEDANVDGGIIVAAGGDGTIRTVAQKAAGRTIRFAVVPIGTFNFFARTHRIPENAEAALRLALTGEARPVRLGEVNGHVFLINASLGLYAKAILQRERRTSIWGRNRFVVIVSTILSLLSKNKLLKVEMVVNQQPKFLRTPMIFIGNNALQLRDVSFSVARCMTLDLLAVVIMKPLSKIEILRVIFRGIFKTIEKEEKLESFCVDSLVIHTHKSRQMVALDGEMFFLEPPLHIHSLPRILNMVLPPALPFTESP